MSGRYDVECFVFGTGPNDFVKEVALRLPPGPFLCLAEGEGRKAVYLASLGYTVSAMDQSASGLSKARQLAATRGVSIETILSDLGEFKISPDFWSDLVSTFVHLPPEARKIVHRKVTEGLRLGGYVCPFCQASERVHGRKAHELAF